MIFLRSLEPEAVCITVAVDPLLFPAFGLADMMGGD
jgi:hypothetical protein